MVLVGEAVGVGTVVGASLKGEGRLGSRLGTALVGVFAVGSGGWLRSSVVGYAIAVIVALGVEPRNGCVSSLQADATGTVVDMPPPQIAAVAAAAVLGRAVSLLLRKHRRGANLALNYD